jgi:signal transduction histidine kinase
VKASSTLRSSTADLRVNDRLRKSDWLEEDIGPFQAGGVSAHAAESVVISVHNQGPEIPEPLRATLFDAFTTSRPGSSAGLGLGLYIVSRIVQTHGGSIDVQSRAGEGTTFRVTLPRV